MFHLGHTFKAISQEVIQLLAAALLHQNGQFSFPEKDYLSKRNFDTWTKIKKMKTFFNFWTKSFYCHVIIYTLCSDVKVLYYVHNKYINLFKYKFHLVFQLLYKPHILIQCKCLNSTSATALQLGLCNGQGNTSSF